jgi:hypothetical protein
LCYRFLKGKRENYPLTAREVILLKSLRAFAEELLLSQGQSGFRGSNFNYYGVISAQNPICKTCQTKVCVCVCAVS